MSSTYEVPTEPNLRNGDSHTNQFTGDVDKEHPPHYHEAVKTDSGDEAFGQDTQLKSEQFRSNELYPENKYGELGRTDSDSDMVQPSQAINQRPNLVHGESEFYAENRFGELGRRDTELPVGNHASFTDKLKGTAEQVVGKLIGNQELHDKGIHRKSSPAFAS